MGVDFGRTFNQRVGASAPRTKTCKFITCDRPYGPDPWCGKAAKENSSYCDHHHAITHEPLDENLNRNFRKSAEYFGRMSR